jgi:hypothetical protein
MDLTIEQAERLSAWHDLHPDLETLSNAEIGEAVLHYLWGYLPLLTPASDLVAEVLRRVELAPEPAITARTDLPNCRCGCPPHPGRLCLATLDCLCTGYQPTAVPGKEQ